MEPVSLADQLRAIADELDAQTAAAPVPAAPDYSHDLEAAKDAQAAEDATAPPGVSAAGWEAFVRGDNFNGLDAGDQAALLAAGFQPGTIAAPSEPVSAPAPADPPVTTPVPVPADPGATDASQAGDSTGLADQPVSSQTSVSGTSNPSEPDGSPAESVPAPEGS